MEEIFGRIAGKEKKMNGGFGVEVVEGDEGI